MFSRVSCGVNFDRFRGDGVLFKQLHLDLFSRGNNVTLGERVAGTAAAAVCGG